MEMNIMAEYKFFAAQKALEDAINADIKAIEAEYAPLIAEAGLHWADKKASANYYHAKDFLADLAPDLSGFDEKFMVYLTTMIEDAQTTVAQWEAKSGLQEEFKEDRDAKVEALIGQLRLLHNEKPTKQAKPTATQQRLNGGQSIGAQQYNATKEGKAEAAPKVSKNNGETPTTFAALKEQYREVATV